MSKNIVVCCDGTENSKDPPPRNHWTNVAKLHESLHGDDKRHSLYIRGIGTHGLFERVFGPAMGYGIEQNIKEAYRHICSLYEPYQDHIYLFGFSRGAYTVRSLAGFVKRVGLLLKDRSDAMIDEAFLYYWWGENVPGSSPLSGYLHRLGLPQEPPEDKRIFIYLIGVWDSVSALGLPGIGARLSAPWTNYHRVELPDHVTHAYQALALHELRACFAPVMWSSRHRGQTLEQMWFAGAHSDVGGGYENTALSDLALRWMQEKAYAADQSPQRLDIRVGEHVAAVSPAPTAFLPENTIVDVFEAFDPEPRALFRSEYKEDALGDVWDTIRLHKSVRNHLGNEAARDYRYGIAAVNQQLRKIDDRILRFHLEQLTTYGTDFAS
jgi:uncharacterized protein (DUF2235 family)